MWETLVGYCAKDAPSSRSRWITSRSLVESRGGYVSQKPGNVPRVDGMLAMTRAFGDGKVKEHITSDPDVRVEKIDHDSKLVVLASDGIWKVMSNEDVSECIEDIGDSQEAAEELVKMALCRGSPDDISSSIVNRIKTAH